MLTKICIVVVVYSLRIIGLNVDPYESTARVYSTTTYVLYSTYT
jgi:hypothetical protein